MPRSPITRPEYRLGKKPGNAGRRYPAEVLTREEFLRMRDAFRVDGPHYRTGTRDRAMWDVICRSGLRIGEVLALEMRDIDLRYGRLLVRHGKGDKDRIVPIDAFTAIDLGVWLALREQLVTGQALAVNVSLRKPFPGAWAGTTATAGPVFCVTKGKTLGRELGDSAVREAIKLIADQVDIERRVHPHGGRHFVAFEWIMEGAPLPVIRDLLGHERIRTTELYADKLRGPAEVLRFAHNRPDPRRAAAHHNST